MKLFLCLLLLCSRSPALFAQNNTLTALPPGRYITVVNNGQGKWERGDILLLDGQHYRVSGETEAGDYRTSITAQRIFFTSGALKGAYARLLLHNNQPAIELPEAANNARTGAAGVIAVLKP